MTIDELQENYNELLQRARPVDGKYSLLTERTDDGAPHVEIDDDGYHFVTTERGLELARQTFATPDELLYRAIELVTLFIGSDYEFKNRIETQDSRRIMFAKQLEVFEKIDPAWAARRQREIAEILEKNPYIDRL
jgi:hypothetical protein